MVFQARASIALSDPEKTIALICGDLEDHDAATARESEAHIIRFPNSRARLRAHGRTLSMVAEAEDVSELHYMKMVLAAHVVEHGQVQASSIVWEGDAGEAIPPYFRFMKVVGVKTVTPHMRRVRLAGDDLTRFFTEDNLHVILVIPPAGVDEPAWPRIGANGLVEWPDSDRRPVTRHYTIRAFDRDRHTVDIDFVVHDSAGPGSSWAENAKAGQVVGMAGPIGLGIGIADWYLLAGDETALPAIARILENLPATARGLALIEVADAAEEQVIDVRADFEIRWLHRNGAVPGTTTLLADAVQAVEFPADLSGVFAWAGCEFDAFKAIRSYLRKEKGLRKEDHLVVSYWRKGRSEDQAGNSPENEH